MRSLNYEKIDRTFEHNVDYKNKLGVLTYMPTSSTSHEKSRLGRPSTPTYYCATEVCTLYNCDKVSKIANSSI